MVPMPRSATVLPRRHRAAQAADADVATRGAPAPLHGTMDTAGLRAGHFSDSEGSHRASAVSNLKIHESASDREPKLSIP